MILIGKRPDCDYLEHCIAHAVHCGDFTRARWLRFWQTVQRPCENV